MVQERTAVLLHAPNKTAAAGMFLIAERLLQNKIPVLVLLEDNISIPSGIPTVNFPKKDFATLKERKLAALKAPKSFLKKTVMPWLLRTSKGQAFAAKRWKTQYDKKTRWVESILDEFNPSTVFAYGDRGAGLETALLVAAHERRVKIVIPPIATFADFEGLLALRLANKLRIRTHSVTRNRKFREIYPHQWRFDKRHKHAISYYPPWLTYALEKNQVLPKNPWVMGSGLSETVCVFGEWDQSRLLAGGTPPEKIAITGSLNCDSLYSKFLHSDEIKSILKNKYKMPNKPLMIVALPQLYEHNLVSIKEHWLIQELICDAASKTEWNVLVSLHPKMERERYDHLCDRYDVFISDDSLSDILVASDLFLVGQGSSTIPWGVLSEVPMVIADFYGLNYKMYDWLHGKAVIEKKEQVHGLLRSITADVRKREEMRSQHRRQKHLISPFDGKCMQRILEQVT